MEKGIEKDVVKPFNVTHQKVTLDCEFQSRTIFASTELQVYFNTVEVALIRLHSKNCEILSVSVNDKFVQFQVFDPCVELCQNEQVKDGKCDTLLFQKVFEFARNEADQGELSIELPKDIKLEEHLAPEVVSKREDTNDTDVSFEKKPTSPLKIKIDYSIVEPDIGIMFASNYRVSNNQGTSFLYTLNQQGPGVARCWVPSRDDAHEKCTWELDFIVSQGTETEDETGFSVIASGLLVSQERLPLDGSRSLVHYFIPFPCPAYLVCFVLGKFDSLLITELDNYQTDQVNFDNEDTELSKKVMAYAPLGWKEELRNSCQTVEKIMDFYMNEFGSYPNDSVKLVFLPTSNMPLIVGAEVSLLSLEFLHSEDIIDQTFETRRLIALAIASQWFGVSVVPKTSPDIWMVLGLSGFMTSLFLKTHFGQNEYRYRMKHDMLNIAHLDVNRPPLFNSRLTSPFDPEDLNFVRLKSTFVLYMLDKQMVKGAASAGLHRMIQKVLISAMCGELSSGNTLSTHWFLKTCRKLSGVDLKGFAEQWIYCSGCPTFQFSYSFNRKKMVVEIDVKQSNTNVGIGDDPNLSLEAIKPAKFFSGHMTASIREPDGTPYEHVLDIQEDVSRFEVQFNTKYKRIRRSTKRFQKRKAEAAAAEAIVKDQLDGDNADNDDLFLTEEGKEKEKEDWRIVEWGEADEESLESATFEWIRLDSDFEWICLIELDQPDYMWAGQLEKDRDVVSQYEAVQALKKFPSQATSTTLLRTVMNTQCFYRIRADAADALGYCSLEQLNYIGRHHLVRIFHKKYCIDEQEHEHHPENFLLRPNDFTNLSEYFVQKAVILAISNLDKDLFEPVSHKLLSNLLVNNDNSNNTYSDCYFISTMITALGNALDTPASTRQGKTVQLLVDELKRYSTMDYLIPSFQNVITVSCLQTYTKLFLRGTIQPDWILLLTHSRYGNFSHVRMVAFDGLLLLGGLLIPAIRSYLLASLESDPDYYLRYYLSSNLTKICAIYQGKAVEKECRLVANQAAYSMNSLDGLSNSHHVSSQWVQFRESSEYQQTFNRMLASSSLDHRVRNNLNILCRILYTDSIPDKLNFSLFQIRICEPSTHLNQPPAPDPVPKTTEPSLILKMKIPREEPHSDLPKQSRQGSIQTASPKVQPKELEKTFTSKPSTSKETYRKVGSDGRGLSESDAGSAKKLLTKLAEHGFGSHLAGKRSRDMLKTDQVEEHPITILKLRGKLHNGKFLTLSSLQIEIDKMFEGCWQLHGSDETMARGLLDLHGFYQKESRQLLGWVTGPFKMSKMDCLSNRPGLPNPTSPNLTSLNPTSPNFTSLNPTSPNLTSLNLTSPNLTSLNLTSPNLTSLNLTSPNLTSPNLTSLNPTSLNPTFPNPTFPNPTFPNPTFPNPTSPNLTSLNLTSPNPTSPNRPSLEPESRLESPKEGLHQSSVGLTISPKVVEESQVSSLTPLNKSPIGLSLDSPTSSRHPMASPPLSGEQLPSLSKRPAMSPVPKEREVHYKLHQSHGMSPETFDSPPHSKPIATSPTRTSIKLTVRPPSSQINQEIEIRGSNSSNIRLSGKTQSPSPIPRSSFDSKRDKRSFPHNQPRDSDTTTIRIPGRETNRNSQVKIRPPKSPSPIRNSPPIQIRPPKSPLFIPPIRLDSKRDERPHPHKETRVLNASFRISGRDSHRNTPSNSTRISSPSQNNRKGSNREQRPCHERELSNIKDRPHLKREAKDSSPTPTKIKIRPPRTPSPIQKTQTRLDPKREERSRLSRETRDSNKTTSRMSDKPNQTPSHPTRIKIRPPIDTSPVPQSGTFYHSEDYFTCKDLLKSLMHSDEAKPFVFPTELIPGGHRDSLELPSLTSVRTNLKSNLYSSVDDMKDHLKTIISQCLNAMDKRSELYHSARLKKKRFFQDWDETFQTKKRYLSDSESIFNNPSPKRRDVSKHSSKSSSKPGLSHLPSVVKKLPPARYQEDSDTFKITREVSTHSKLKQRTLVYDYCCSILKKLDNHHSAVLFREPVDPVLLGIPTYFEIITHPMDLKSVRSKLEARKYIQFSEFDHDIRLIVRNACRFNQPDTWVYSEAQRLEDYYDSQINDFDGTFLTKDDINKLIGILERFNREPFSDTFMPITKYDQYLETSYDLVSLVTLLSANKFLHIGDFEAAIQKLLHICYSLFSPTDIEYDHTLQFEKKYVKHFERAFDRKSVIGQVSLLPPVILLTDSMKIQCRQILKRLTALKASKEFLEPVDYKRWNLPHYPNMIRQPMDLGTVEKKLTSGAYHTTVEFEKDVLLVCYNCYNFNGLDSDFSIEAKKLEKFFRKEWDLLMKNSSFPNLNPSQPLSRSSTKSVASKWDSKPVSRSPAPPPILSSFTLQLMKEALIELQKKPKYFYFAAPVDPILLNIPTYFDKIKFPMDFGTMQDKLKRGKYLTLEPFLADAQLVFTNCYTFNHPSDVVFKAGKTMEAAWKAICKEKGLVEDIKSPVEISIISPQVSNRSSLPKSRVTPRDDRRGSDSRRRSDDIKSKVKSRR